MVLFDTMKEAYIMTIDNDDTKGTEMDDFDMAFDEAAVGVEAETPAVAVETPVVAVEPPVVETPVVETPVVETPVVETPVVAVETPVVETPVVAVETPVVETPVVETPAKAPVKTEAQIRTEILAEQTATQNATKKTDDAKAARKVLEDKTKLTPEEEAELVEEQKDFQGLTKVFATAQRIAEAKFNLQLSDLREEMQANLQPVIASTQAVASNAVEAAVLTKHADAFDVLPAVHAWIDTQPVFLQDAYTKALSGDAAQIVGVFDQYKAAQPAVAAAEPTAEEVAAQKVKDDAALVVATELETARQKKLDSMTGTKTVSSNRTEGIAEDDFDGAFEQAARS